MRKLTFILFILIFTNSFCQETEFMEVTKIIEYNESLIDTLKIEKWNSLHEKRKIKIRKYAIENNLRIENDSSSKAQFLYYGLPEKVKIVSTDFDKIFSLEKQSEKYHYPVVICYPIKEKTYELISFDRNSGIKEFTIYFIDSKRTANLKVDTRFSEIYIKTRFDIELVEFDDEALPTGLDADGKLIPPKPVKEKLVKMVDEIIIDQKYKQQKHSL
jgi:hypothetical protein